MRAVLVVGGGVPNPSAGGGAVTAWTVMSQLLAEGHEVGVCVLRDPELYDPTGVPAERRVEQIQALGGSVVEVVSGSTAFFRTRPRNLGARLKRAWRPRDDELYPNLVDRDAVTRAVSDLDADVVFAYHVDALVASRGVDRPTFAAVGDPPHLAALHRFRAELPSPRALRRSVWLQAQLRHQPRLLVRYLNECQARGAFAAHHAAWLRRRGVADCAYLRTPVPDAVGERWRSERDRLRPEKPRVLLVGHLKGVVTLEGLRVFASEVLPRLETALGADGLEARIVGGYEPPPELTRLLDRPAVRFLGHVEDPAEEFGSASVLLVPNSIPLGVRVRILTGFSYGVCVVSHSANKQGIPELEHGRNALLGGSGTKLARAVLEAIADDGLRARLEEGARQTYESSFSPSVAAGRIVATLEQITASRGATRQARGRTARRRRSNRADP